MANKLRFVFPFRSITRTMAITADRLIVSQMIHPIFISEGACPSTAILETATCART